MEEQELLNFLKIVLFFKDWTQIKHKLIRLKKDDIMQMEGINMRPNLYLFLPPVMKLLCFITSLTIVL